MAWRKGLFHWSRWLSTGSTVISPGYVIAAEPHLDQMLTKISGSATSPDALYIYDSIAAANEILHIALRLAQMGSLRYLPSRYLINISYAAVFALKSSYSGAVEEKDMHR